MAKVSIYTVINKMANGNLVRKGFLANRVEDEVLMQSSYTPDDDGEFFVETHIQGDEVALGSYILEKEITFEEGNPKTVVSKSKTKQEVEPFTINWRFVSPDSTWIG